MAKVVFNISGEPDVPLSVIVKTSENGVTSLCGSIGRRAFTLRGDIQGLFNELGLTGGGGGSPGDDGAPGPRGGEYGTWGFASETADANPGAGLFRLNNATPASATFLYISTSDDQAVDQTPWLLSWISSTNPTDGTISLIKKGTEEVVARYYISGFSVATGYRKFGLTYISGSGSFIVGDDIDFVINRTGDIGSSGSNGISAPNAFMYEYNYFLDEESYPAEGFLGTFGSYLMVNKTTANGVNIGAIIQSMVDSTNNPKAHIFIQSVSNPAALSVYTVSSISDIGGNTLLLGITPVEVTVSALSDVIFSIQRIGDAGA